jgi:DNA processing protein
MSGTDAQRRARITLAHLVEPGSRDLGELVLRVGPVRALRQVCGGDVTPRLREATSARLAAIDPQTIAGAALDVADRLGVRIATPEDDEWPRQLADLGRLSRDVADPIQRDTYPPQCLWLRGPWRLNEACERSVSVVGARASTPYGDHIATDLGFNLAQRQWSVVSGGAFGIDAAVHRGVLAGDGCTVVVLACGIDRPYPVSHTNLFDAVAEQGLLLTEWPPGADPHRRRFLIRNRVIAALTTGTVMVEANLRSGARFTLNRARDLGRLAMVLPGPVTSAMSAGCHEELRVEGTVLVTNVDHVIEAVGRIGEDLAPALRAEEDPRDRLTPLQRQILDGVRPRKLLSAEQIAAVVGVSTSDARRTMPSLEAARFVTARDGGYRLWRKSDDHPQRPP